MRALVLDDDAWAALHTAVAQARTQRGPKTSAGPLLRAHEALSAALPEDRAVHEIALFLDTEYEWPEIGYRDWCSVALDALTVLERQTR